MKHLLLRLKLLKELTEEAAVELGDDLVSVLGMEKVDAGIGGEFTSLVADLVDGVELVVGLDRDRSPRRPWLQMDWVAGVVGY